LCERSFSNNSYVEKRKISNVDRFFYRSSEGIIPVSHDNYKMLIRWRETEDDVFVVAGLTNKMLPVNRLFIDLLFSHLESRNRATGSLGRRRNNDEVDVVRPEDREIRVVRRT
jgi:hypothetical protein